MREILFRGRTVSENEYIDDGEWITGFYTCFNGEEHRIYTGYSETDCGDHYPDWFNVLPETVGQYIGVNDKNGKKIFEGDIIQTKRTYGKKVNVFRFVIKCGAYVPEEYCKEIYSQNEVIGFYAFDGKKDFVLSNCSKALEVIGNIHDNPELLRV